MASTQKYLNHLLQSVGITPACSEEERTAADVIAGVFRNHGFEPQIQEFSASASVKITQAVLGVAVFLGALFMGLGGVLGVVGLLLCLIAAVLYVMERNGKPMLSNIGNGGLSQNVIAYHKASGPMASPRNRPVVVVAHYDSPRAELLSQEPFSAYRSLLVKLLPYAMVAPVVIAVLRLLPLPGGAKVLLWIVAILAALVPLVCAVNIIANRLILPYTSGSVCNKSSVAAMLGVMDAVAPYQGENEFPQDKPFDEYMADQEALVAQMLAEQEAARVGAEGDDGLPDEGQVAPRRVAAPARRAPRPVPDEPVQSGPGETQTMSARELAEAAREQESAPVAVDTPEAVEEGAAEDEALVPDSNAAAEEAPAVEAAPVADDTESPEPSEEPASVQEPLPVPPVNVEGNIRYGAEVIASLGMVPDTCRIEYEEGALPEPPAPVEPAAAVEEPAPQPVSAVIPAAEPASDEEERVIYGPVDTVDSDFGVESEDEVDSALDQANPAIEDESSTEEETFDQSAEEEVSFDERPTDMWEAQPEGYIDAPVDENPYSDTYEEELEDGYPIDAEYELIGEDEALPEDEDLPRVRTFASPELIVDEDDYDDDDDDASYDHMDVEIAATQTWTLDDERAEESPADDGAEVEGQSAADAPAASDGDVPAGEMSASEESDPSGELSADDAADFDQEQPKDGETQVFELTEQDSAEATRSMEELGKTATYRPVETVDSLMAQIDAAVPRKAPAPRPQRTINVPDVSAPARQPAPRQVPPVVPDASALQRAVPSNRASLFDIPDPSATPADPFATVQRAPVSQPSASTSRPAPSRNGFTVIGPNDPAPSVEPAQPAQAAPRADSIQTISAPAPATEKPKRGLGKLFGRKKKQQDSMSEWLGVDETFDAKSTGSEIGSWDNFDSDDTGWKGGATGAEGVSDLELRDAITSLGDDELLGHDIWFVATGASECGNAGIKAFLAAHRDKLRGVFLINLESVGAGRVSMLATEGENRVLKGDRRIMKLVQRVSADFHNEFGTVDMPCITTDAHAAMSMSLRSLTIAGVDATHLACSHSEEDQPFNVDANNVQMVADVVTEVIRRS